MSGEPLVLHILPTAVARGAQREARALRERLDEPGVRRHRLLSLFAGSDEVPVDESLGHRGRAGAVAEGIDPRLVLRLRRHLAAEDPAVVVAHGGDALKYVVPASIGSPRRIAYYATGTFGAAHDRRRIWLWRTLVRRADVVACEGDEVLAECGALLRVPAPRLVLAPNGRDPWVFRPEPAADADGSHPPVLAFVGALTSGKGPDRFVEAAAQLRTRGLDFRAVVYGDGELRHELVDPAVDAGVELAGRVDDVASVLRRADVFVFPSRPTGEGMPGVLIEAGLSALPVVACRGPGVDMIVDDGVTGIVVDQDDPAALVDGAVRLLRDPALRARMGAAARQRCEERFGIDAVVDVWRSFLLPLVASRP